MRCCDAEWQKEVSNHGDDWCRTGLFVGFWVFTDAFVLVRLFLNWDWDHLSPNFLAALALSGFLMLLACLSRFWWIHPCHRPRRVQLSFLLHALALATTIWSWVCFSSTGLPVFAEENDGNNDDDKSISPDALYYIRVLLALVTLTHIANLFVCGCHAACNWFYQAPPASASSFTLAPLQQPQQEQHPQEQRQEQNERMSCIPPSKTSPLTISCGGSDDGDHAHHEDEDNTPPLYTRSSINSAESSSDVASTNLSEPL